MRHASHRQGRRGYAAAFAGIVLLASAGAVLAAPPDAGQGACDMAAVVVEAQAGLPPGLLRAIGQVETGRFDATTGRTEPWPWSANMAGADYIFASKAEAVAWTAAQLALGQRSIDVGCFQVNLKYHPAAFASLDEAFDPPANARYAAVFLNALYGRLGAWQVAAADYHSADPALGTPYGQRVFDLIGGVGAMRVGLPAVRDGHSIMRPARSGFGIQIILPDWAHPAVLVTSPASVAAAPLFAQRMGPVRRIGRLPRVFTPD